MSGAGEWDGTIINLTFKFFAAYDSFRIKQFIDRSSLYQVAEQNASIVMHFVEG